MANENQLEDAKSAVVAAQFPGAAAPVYSTMTVEQGDRMAFGGRAIWSQHAFVDMFLDACLPKGHSHYAHMSRPPSGLMGLTSALLFMNEVTNRLSGGGGGGMSPASEPSLSALAVQAANPAAMQDQMNEAAFLLRIAQAVTECTNLCNQITMAQNDQNRFFKFIFSLVGRIQHLRVGDLLLLPGGWSTAPSAKDIKDAAASGAPPPQNEFHVVLYVLHKRVPSNSEDRPRSAAFGAGNCEFSFSVVNTGKGLEYHAANMDETSSHMRRNLAFEVRPTRRPTWTCGTARSIPRAP